ncbi:MAG: DUF4230 domain-containing protein [Anaerolineae bacterium]|nr:DUF4230 domain-containing protein [Anaerolineae bacterium]
MDKLGRILLWLALISLVALGTLIVLELREGVFGLIERGPQLPLIPQPTPTIYPSAATVIHSIQRLSRLETASYHIEKVITAETGQGPLGFLFGDRLLLIAFGEVIAGVDLAEIEADDVLRNDDGTLYVKLPPAEVFVATLDNEQTHVYDRRTGMVGLNQELETAARREAERLILEAALEDGIEAEAAANAEDVLRSFLLALGFDEVRFADVLPTPTPEPTPTPDATETAVSPSGP